MKSYLLKYFELKSLYVVGSSENNLCRSPQSLDDLDQIVSNCSLDDKFIEQHQVVPPSYQHATGESYGYPPCRPTSQVSLTDGECSPLASSTPPPVEIPPKKRNMIQGDRLSASLGMSYMFHNFNFISYKVTEKTYSR